MALPPCERLHLFHPAETEGSLSALGLPQLTPFQGCPEQPEETGWLLQLNTTRGHYRGY